MKDGIFLFLTPIACLLVKDAIFLLIEFASFCQDGRLSLQNHTLRR